MHLHAASMVRGTSPVRSSPAVPDDPKPPSSSRLGRTGRVGGLVAGQGLRWAGTRAANLVRSPEQADAATGERATALARELVEQLGQMRGAAMKIGQVLSTVDFTAIPEADREEFKRTLASLRDEVPPLPFKRMEKLLGEELGAPLGEHFADFEREAFAAASIGQVHRAVTHDGRRVAVKVQYPGVAEAVETDLRNMQVLLPLVKRLAPGLDVKALAGELRERIAEELDYEIEAQNHRAWSAPGAGIRSSTCRRRHRLSSRRVLVTELLEGRRFEAVKALGEAERDRFGEIVFRFFFGTLNRLRRACGDPHPGNYLLLDDGRVGFLDFGLMRVVDADYLAGERALAQAALAGDADGVHAGLSALGYLPDPRAFEPERVLAAAPHGADWYLTPGFRRLSPGYVAELIERGSSPRSEFFEEMRRETIPPQALLIRRMEGLVLSVLGELRAGGDWAALGAEYFAGEPPSTPLGELDAAVLGRRAAPPTPRRLRGAMRRTLLIAACALLALAPPALGRHPRRRPPGAVRQADRAGEGRNRRCRSCCRRSCARTSSATTPRERRDAGGWRFDIGAVRGCHTATVCFIAEFRGVRGAKPSAPPHVRLARGRTGSSGRRRAARPARRRASSGASAARCTRSRRRSPATGGRWSRWPTRPSATARAEPPRA